MGYRELLLSPPSGSRPEMRISGHRYELEAFGMDDGRATGPDAAFRFLFQLGSELMIYLYVVHAGASGNPGYFAHSFWQKDSSVAEVELEEWGPPATVFAGPIALPLVYPSVTLRTPLVPAASPRDAGTPVECEERTFAIDSQRFRAQFERRGAQDLSMDFALRDPNGSAARLSWTCRAAWQFELPGAPARAVRADERLLFGGGGVPEAPGKP